MNIHQTHISCELFPSLPSGEGWPAGTGWGRQFAFSLPAQRGGVARRDGVG